MLSLLRIENFAIVSLLELDLRSGMTAFTGETGAGKSIMVDALMLALGERVDASVIRPGTDKCDIQACFTIDPDSAPAAWLAAHDIPHEQEVYLRRLISHEGRSKSTINGHPFPLQKVKELSEMLVDIHGQHQHQSLLQHATHRQQLDQYGNHQTLLDEVKQHYRQCQTYQHAIEVQQNQTHNEERLALLRYQLAELKELQLSEGEAEALHQEHQLLHHARTYLENTNNISELLNGDEQLNIRQALHHALQLLQSLPTNQSQIKNLGELLNGALIQCDEALDELTHFADKVQLDPERLQIVEARLSALHQAARKYHIDISQLPAHQQQLQQELSALQNSAQSLEQLQQQYAIAEAAYQAAAIRLRTARETTAHKLSAEITTTIQQLGMPKGYIKIAITPLERMQAHGLDKVEYQVCTNPGMLPDSLHKIASGGELSRISLGIHMITAQRGATPTLVFDEVDVGIGGATAALVGHLLRKLGTRLQVICVTHQPQVGACAHHHYCVEKLLIDEVTHSRVTLLNASERIDEIARMLGGLTITQQTRSHAQELLAIDVATS